MQSESGNKLELPSIGEIAAGALAEFPGSIVEFGQGVDMPCLRVALEAIVPVGRWLRDEPGLRFTLLSDLTCVDFLDRSPRFDVIYHLYSLQSNSYMRLKTGVRAEPCECPTVSEVWETANWLEREVYDMFGIAFTGHPDLRRILTPDGWPYYALRRDFPLQGPGVVKLYDSVSDVF